MVKYSALGAVLGFYCIASLGLAGILTFLLLSLAVLCLFRVLSSLDPQSRSLRLAAVNSIAVAAGLCLGICAASAGRNIVKFGIPEEKIIAIEGVLLEDPRVISEGRIMASLNLKKSAGAKGLRVSSSGSITVFFPEESALKLRSFGRGTAVFAEGRLRNADKGYIFSADSLHITKAAPPLQRMRTDIRLKLIERFEGSGSSADAWGGLALALLVGIRDSLDSNLTLQYRSAGLSYILALSGMHLAVITALISFLLKKPLGLKPAAIAGALIICLYCFITGPMPSLNRAAIMYLIGVLAVLGALPKNTMSILALSFLIQIVISPASGNSISFILSYLAMLGILIVGKALSSLLAGKVPDFVLQPLAISCGAFLATAGVCYSIFGYIAPAGIIAGLVIVPATTVFMIGSLIWLVLDLVSLSGILNAPLYLLYLLMEKTASVAGKAPAINAANPSLILVLSILLSLIIAAFEYRRRTALLRLEPFA
jgi:competence protein ComEC